MPDIETLLIDAIRMTALPITPPHLLFGHVLSIPFSCPGSCSEQYVIMTSLPVELEVQRGQCGQKHLMLLCEELQRHCASENGICHLRTDGSKVWVPT